MPKNSFLQAIFPKIRYSISPINKNNKGTTQIGRVIPVYATTLQGKESISLDLGHLVRFAPSIVPTMEGYEVNFEAFKVSYNALAYANRKERDVMDFHNIALNDGSEVNPFCVRFEYMQPRIDGVHSGVLQGDFFRPGLLGDYLNFPSYKSFRDYVRAWLNRTPLFDGSFQGRSKYSGSFTPNMQSYFEFIARYNIGNFTSLSAPFVSFSNSDNDIYLVAVPFAPSSSVVYPISFDEWQSAPSSFGSLFYVLNINDDNGEISDFTINYPSLLRYICDNYPLVASYYMLDKLENYDYSNYLHNIAWATILQGLDQNEDFTLNYLDVLYKLYKVDAQTVFDEWFDGLVAYLLNNPLLKRISDDATLMSAGYLPDIYSEDMKPVDWSYFAAYWKIISDWYINTNIDGDPDDFFLSKCNIIGVHPNEYVELRPFLRRWENDIFTSAVPSSKVTNIAIPINGDIPDLRNANAMQRLKDILRNTGSRLADVLFGVRGYRPSAEASHMSVPVGALHSFVGMSSILQTTPTTAESPQGNYAGIGTDSSNGRHILKVVNNDEPVPVIVMVMMSITERPSYMQGFPRSFFRTSIYDFAIPQLANVGEQEVMSSELYFDYDADGNVPSLDTVFGFNRRYYDWFFEANEVHGYMRDSEDFWHGARIFDSAPALNSEFIAIDAKKDHLNRIFANSSPSGMPIYYNVYFSGEKCVALPRYIQYDL